MTLSGISLAVSLLILCISFTSLYLSHFKEHRSQVKLLSQESGPGNAFSGGNFALDGDAFWEGHDSLKFSNMGAKGAYVSSVSHELLGLQNGDCIDDSTEVELEEWRTDQLREGIEIEAHSIKRLALNFRITPKEDIGVLIEHELAIIQHTLTIEDNKGSYDISHESEMELTGPRDIHEKWSEEASEHVEVG